MACTEISNFFDLSWDSKRLLILRWTFRIAIELNSDVTPVWRYPIGNNRGNAKTNYHNNYNNSIYLRPVCRIHTGRTERLRRAVRLLTLVSVFWTAKTFITACVSFCCDAQTCVNCSATINDLITLILSEFSLLLSILFGWFEYWVNNIDDNVDTNDMNKFVIPKRLISGITAILTSTEWICRL